MTRYFLCLAAFVLLPTFVNTARGQDDFNAAIRERVDRFVEAMTLEEKVGQTVMEIRPM